MNFIIGKGTVLKNFLGTQLITTMGNGHCFCKLSQKDSFFYRRIATTNDQEILVSKESTITNSTVGNPSTIQLLFARDIQWTVVRPCCNHHGFSFKFPIICDNLFGCSVVFDALYLSKQMFHTKIL